jgi:hypothetical protein
LGNLSSLPFGKAKLPDTQRRQSKIVKRPLFQQASQTRSGPPRTTLRGKGTDKSGPHGLDFPYAKPQYNPKVTTNAAALLSAWLVASHHRCLLHPLFHPRHSRSPTVCEHGPRLGSTPEEAAEALSCGACSQAGVRCHPRANTHSSGLWMRWVALCEAPWEVTFDLSDYVHSG